MTVMLNPPSFPTPPAAPGAAADNHGDSPQGDSGFAHALLAARRPARGEMPACPAAGDAEDPAKAEPETEVDGIVTATAWPVPMQVDVDRADARLARTGDRRDPAVNALDPPSIAPMAATASAGPASAGAPEMLRAQIAALPDAIASAREASRGITPDERKAKTVPDPAGASPERSLDAAPPAAGVTTRTLSDATRVAARPARGDASAESVRGARPLRDGTGPRQEASNLIGGPSAAPDSATDPTKALESAAASAASAASAKSRPVTSDPLFTGVSAATAGHAPAPEVIAVTAPVASAQWSGEVTGKLAQLIVMRQDHVELRLNPPQLGPVDVQVHMTGGQATVLIAAPHPVTRDALEQALPQLREALAAQGITLGQATVGSETQPRDTPPLPRATESDPRAPLPVAEPPRRAPGADRLVDTFA